MYSVVNFCGSLLHEIEHSEYIRGASAFDQKEGSGSKAINCNCNLKIANEMPDVTVHTGSHSNVMSLLDLMGAFLKFRNQRSHDIVSSNISYQFQNRFISRMHSFKILINRVFTHGVQME